MNAPNYLRPTRLNAHSRPAFSAVALLSVCALLSIAGTSHAVPISLSPAVATFSGMNNGALGAAAVGSVTGTTGLTVAYKQNAGGAEEGGFAGSYATAFTNTLSDPSAALITYDGGNDPFITGGRIFLYVKDGTPRPWYLFDISSWNGKDALQLTGFYTGPGSISQLTIFTSPNGVIIRTPEAGSTLALLGCAVVTIGAVRRKLMS